MSDENVLRDLSRVARHASFFLYRFLDSDRIEFLRPASSNTPRYELMVGAVLDEDPTENQDHEQDIWHEPSDPSGMCLLARIPDPVELRDIDQPQTERVELTSLPSEFHDHPRRYEETTEVLGTVLSQLLSPGEAPMVSRSAHHIRDEDRHFFVYFLLRIDAASQPQLLDATSFPRYALQSLLESFRNSYGTFAHAVDTPAWFRNEELILRAAESFVGTLCCVPGALLFGRVLGKGPYQELSAISSLNYENSEACGQIELSTEDQPHCVRLNEPVPLSDGRRVRKLLQATSARLTLVLANDAIVGIRSVPEVESQSRLCLSFQPKSVWEVRREGQLLLRVVRGIPELPSRTTTDWIGGVLSQRFPDLPEGGRFIEAVVEDLRREKHGGLFVFTEELPAEAERLSDQATRVTPLPVSGALLADLSKVDGAVLCDPKGMIHAFGVILDGTAPRSLSARIDRAEGPAWQYYARQRFLLEARMRSGRAAPPDPRRGARYNSAVLYVHSRREGTRPVPRVTAVVVSEDGMVNVIPTQEEWILTGAPS